MLTSCSSLYQNLCGTGVLISVPERVWYKCTHLSTSTASVYTWPQTSLSRRQPGGIVLPAQHVRARLPCALSHAATCPAAAFARDGRINGICSTKCTGKEGKGIELTSYRTHKSASE
eukprot:3818155-Rhodomonas_salina.1